MNFRKWIELKGGNVAVGKFVGASRVLVFHWANGKSMPRPAMMRKIVGLTRGKMSYGDMVEFYLDNHKAKKVVVKKPTKAVKAKAVKKPTTKKVVAKKPRKVQKLVDSFGFDVGF